MCRSRSAVQKLRPHRVLSRFRMVHHVGIMSVGSGLLVLVLSYQGSGSDGFCGGLLSVVGKALSRWRLSLPSRYADCRLSLSFHEVARWRSQLEGRVLPSVWYNACSACLPRVSLCVVFFCVLVQSVAFGGRRDCWLFVNVFGCELAYAW